MVGFRRRSRRRHRPAPLLHGRIERARDLHADVIDVQPRALSVVGDRRAQVRIERFQLAAEEGTRIIDRGLPSLDPIGERFDVGALEVAAIGVDLHRRRPSTSLQMPLRTSARNSSGRYAAAPSIASCSTSRREARAAQQRVQHALLAGPDAVEHADRLDASEDLRLDRPRRRRERVVVEEAHRVGLLAPGIGVKRTPSCPMCFCCELKPPTIAAT